MSDDIQSFRIQISQSDLDYLHHRLATARWPGELPGTSWTRGIPLDYLQDLAGYWRAQYDWRAAEAQLNAYPQFTTEIDGQTIHFLHVTSKQPGAKPLLITHGFPSSVAEFLHLIEPLVNPAAGQAFHVIAPSLPGYLAVMRDWTPSLTPELGMQPKGFTLTVMVALLLTTLTMSLPTSMWPSPPRRSFE